jgi:ParB family chromosome partitioning protein
MTRKALGRGLNALLRETDAISTPSGLEEISLTLIDPNPFQPRSELSEESLHELANSIRSSGVIQPILVRPAGDRYQLVAGERRWRAASIAGIERVPAVVRSMDDGAALELALTENLLRDALNAIEVAKAYDQLQRKFHLTHDQIAERIGINRSTVTNTLRLLELDPAVQKLLIEEKISAGHARALVPVSPPESQRKIAQLVINKGLSVRHLEKLIATRTASNDGKSAKSAPAVDPNTRAAVLELERRLGTRVKIVGSEKRGKIEISYFSADDLNRIYERIMRH